MHAWLPCSFLDVFHTCHWENNWWVMSCFVIWVVQFGVILFTTHWCWIRTPALQHCYKLAVTSLKSVNQIQMKGKRTSRHTVFSKANFCIYIHSRTKHLSDVAWKVIAIQSIIPKSPHFPVIFVPYSTALLFFLYYELSFINSVILPVSTSKQSYLYLNNLT